MPTAQEILKQYFGYDNFRPGQDELVQAILSGRDTLGIMPTGAGKSICYQVPALALPGLTLVVSPLISLMKDQVGALNEAGVPAACINSALSFEEMRDALYFAGRGEYKLLYVAPERLTAPFFLDFARRVPISMVTVDEAHCISTFLPPCPSARSFPPSPRPRPPRSATTSSVRSVSRTRSSSRPASTAPICTSRSKNRPPSPPPCLRTCSSGATRAASSTARRARRSRRCATCC